MPVKRKNSRLVISFNHKETAICFIGSVTNCVILFVMP